MINSFSHQSGYHAHLVRSNTSAECRPNHFRINILRQLRQEVGIKHTVLLETTVFVVQVVGRIPAVLVPSRGTILAFVADP